MEQEAKRLLAAHHGSTPTALPRTNGDFYGIIHARVYLHNGRVFFETGLEDVTDICEYPNVVGYCYSPQHQPIQPATAPAYGQYHMSKQVSDGWWVFIGPWRP